MYGADFFAARGSLWRVDSVMMAVEDKLRLPAQSENGGGRQVAPALCTTDERPRDRVYHIFKSLVRLSWAKVYLDGIDRA